MSLASAAELVAPRLALSPVTREHSGKEVRVDSGFAPAGADRMLSIEDPDAPKLRGSSQQRRTVVRS